MADPWDIFGAELERCIPAAGWLPLLLLILLLLLALAAGGVAAEGGAAVAVLPLAVGVLGAALKRKK